MALESSYILTLPGRGVQLSFGCINSASFSNFPFWLGLVSAGFLSLAITRLRRTHTHCGRRLPCLSMQV